MNINRHNYEPFFLLYIDNELSDAERKVVELFVDQNPDLQVEFNAIKQTVLQPDYINLNNKRELLKNEQDTIQHLFLLLDNELEAREKKDIEALIAADSAVAREWKIIQQTKLLPDNSITFKNKSSLYKREAAVINIFWKRIAVAAVLLGFGLWMGVQYINTQKENRVEGNGYTVVQKKKDLIPSQNVLVQDSAVIVSPNTVNNIDVTANNAIAKKQKTIITNKQKEGNTVPKADLENINKQASNENTIANVLPETSNTELATSKAPAIDKEEYLIKENIAATDNNSYVAYNELNDEPNDDKILYMDEEKVKRTKLGGLFRKVKRVFERTADIKTGTLKIAGFEIAVR